MSKRCELKKEYYKDFGNYKGVGKYSNHYVKWIENEVLALRITRNKPATTTIPQERWETS